MMGMIAFALVAVALALPGLITVLMSLEIAEQSAPQAQPPAYPAQDGVQGALRPQNWAAGRRAVAARS
jgi:hypothetical protein